MMKKIFITAWSIFLCSCLAPESDGVRVIRLNGKISGPAPATEETTYVTVSSEPGHFNVWKDDALLQNKTSEQHIEIYLSAQRGTFFIDGRPAVTFPVCSGKKGYETPTGTYTILEKRRNHRSNIYHVSMPCFMRLTYDGIGLHVGQIKEYPASHGCIRLPKEACLPIFNAIKNGTKVVIY